MKKKIRKEIEKIAAMLPPSQYAMRSFKIIDDLPEGKINPDHYLRIDKGEHAGRYATGQIIPHPVNHVRRLKRAYERDGKKGIDAYIAKYTPK